MRFLASTTFERENLIAHPVNWTIIPGLPNQKNVDPDLFEYSVLRYEEVQVSHREAPVKKNQSPRWQPGLSSQMIARISLPDK